MIFGVALLLSAPFITKAQSSIVDLRETSEFMDAQNAIQSFENAAETVNAAGEPAKMTFFVRIPSGVERTYVNDRSFSYQIASGEGRANITRSFDFNLTGTLPESEGRHRVSVEAGKQEVIFKVVS